MLIAFLVAAVMWSTPAPVLYTCNPGKTPISAPTNCEKIPFHVIFKFRF